jgi:hypothetical protein
MTEQTLKPCPFCGCAITVRSNRDWHRLIGAHPDTCLLHNDCFEAFGPATDEGLRDLIEAWNTRVASPDTARRWQPNGDE